MHTTQTEHTQEREELAPHTERIVRQEHNTFKKNDKKKINTSQLNLGYKISARKPNQNMYICF